jgi:hypothetical protein
MMLKTLIATLQEKLGDVGNVDVQIGVNDKFAHLTRINLSQSPRFTDGTGDAWYGVPIRSIVTAVSADGPEALLMSSAED